MCLLHHPYSHTDTAHNQRLAETTVIPGYAAYAHIYKLRSGSYQQLVAIELLKLHESQEHLQGISAQSLID